MLGHFDHDHSPPLLPIHVLVCGVWHVTVIEENVSFDELKSSSCTVGGLQEIKRPLTISTDVNVTSIVD